MRNNPVRRHFTIALVLTMAGMVLLWWLVSGRPSWSAGLASWFIAVNVVAFGYYGYDKSQAGGNGQRVPEVVLHGLSASGGSPGAYAAMQLFRHKTMKGRFRILFWCIVVLQLGLTAWLVLHGWLI